MKSLAEPDLQLINALKQVIYKAIYLLDFQDIFLPLQPSENQGVSSWKALMFNHFNY
jgi:hypothetical protein